MSTEIKYDQTNEVKLTETSQDQMENLSKSSELGLSGCHSNLNKEKYIKSMNGNNKLLDKFKKDYPLGPHDKPQSMCPAFGSLRVGLRMRKSCYNFIWLCMLCLWINICFSLLWC